MSLLLQNIHLDPCGSPDHYCNMHINQNLKNHSECLKCQWHQHSKIFLSQDRSTGSVDNRTPSRNRSSIHGSAGGWGLLPFRKRTGSCPRHCRYRWHRFFYSIIPVSRTVANTGPVFCVVLWESLPFQNYKNEEIEFSHIHSHSGKDSCGCSIRRKSIQTQKQR